MHRPITEEEQIWLAYSQQLPRPQDLPDLPEGEPLAEEWKTYKREVVRLLTEGQAGRHVLIQGDRVVSIWDTRADAIQAGYERFGLDTPFAVHEVQPVERIIRFGYSRRCHT